MKISKNIEGQLAALCTVMDNNTPNAIVVEIHKVLDDNKILLTDNYMNQTLKDIKQNPNIMVLIWDNKGSTKFIGEAEYFSEGKYYDIVKALPYNKGFPCKGVVVLTVDKVIEAT
jgi:predicted pyridoxine 5'-phosphate oxidase superfamily flavin-nucleotide-binding protein